MTEIYLDQNWQQIQPQRSVNETNFTSGSILFNFNVSGLNSVSIKDSYFIVKSSLARGDGTAHVVSDKVTYAHNWASALFTNVSVRVSGQEVSDCNQYNHLAHTLKMRQMIDEPLLGNNYRDLIDYDPDFTRRLNKHCYDIGTPLINIANGGPGESQREIRCGSNQTATANIYAGVTRLVTPFINLSISVYSTLVMDHYVVISP